MSDDTEQIYNDDLRKLDCAPPWEWPENAGETLIGILRSRKDAESDRLLAAELAGEYVVVNDEIVDELLSLLCKGDEPEELRGQAAISLGPALESADTDGFEDPEDAPISEQTFHKMLEVLPRVYADANAPKLVRRRVLEAAVRAPQEWQRDAVRAAYASGDPEWKLTAVFGMGCLNGFEPQILESLDSDDSEIVYEAVRAAGNWEVSAAWPRIRAIVASGKADKPVLLAAIEAAISIRIEEVPELVSELLNSKDKDIAAAAAEAIAMTEGAFDDEDDEDPFR